MRTFWAGSGTVSGRFQNSDSNAVASRRQQCTHSEQVPAQIPAGSSSSVAISLRTRASGACILDRFWHWFRQVPALAPQQHYDNVRAAFRQVPVSLCTRTLVSIGSGGIVCEQHSRCPTNCLTNCRNRVRNPPTNCCKIQYKP